MRRIRRGTAATNTAHFDSVQGSRNGLYWSSTNNDSPLGLTWRAPVTTAPIACRCMDISTEF